MPVDPTSLEGSLAPIPMEILPTISIFTLFDVAKCSTNMNRLVRREIHSRFRRAAALIFHLPLQFQQFEYLLLQHRCYVTGNVALKMARPDLATENVYNLEIAATWGAAYTLEEFLRSSGHWKGVKTLSFRNKREVDDRTRLNVSRWYNKVRIIHRWVKDRGLTILPLSGERRRNYDTLLSPEGCHPRPDERTIHVANAGIYTWHLLCRVPQGTRRQGLRVCKDPKLVGINRASTCGKRLHYLVAGIDPRTFWQWIWSGPAADAVLNDPISGASPVASVFRRAYRWRLGRWCDQGCCRDRQDNE